MACKKILSRAGVTIHAEAVGGNLSRTVRLDVGTGRIRWNVAGCGPQELNIRQGAA